MEPTTLVLKVQKSRQLNHLNPKLVDRKRLKLLHLPQKAYHFEQNFSTKILNFDQVVTSIHIIEPK